MSAPALELTEGELGVIVVAALTVMLACADFVPSATLVAFTVAVVVELTCGAVNNPLEETDPMFVLHVTPVLLVLLTEAVSCLVPPDEILALVGETVMLTAATGGLTVTVALALLVGSAALVALTVAVVLVLTFGAV